MLSKAFATPTFDFTRITKAPSSIFMKKKGNRYNLDKNNEFSSSHILGLVGKTLEKFLTVPPETFEHYRLSNRDRSSPQTDLQAYHYSLSSNILVRSQLDAYDSRIPGTGVFDIKTRAVLPIRMSKGDYLETARGYELTGEQGDFESYEREHFDMIRATMLKYSLQARLGHMDGIFCAYHNIDRIFGFQYLSIEDMDLALHGQSDRSLGNREVAVSLKLLQEALDRVSERFPDQVRPTVVHTHHLYLTLSKHVKLYFSTSERRSPILTIFAEPVTDLYIEEVESAARKRAADFDEQIMNADTRGDKPAALDKQLLSVPPFPSGNVEVKLVEDISGQQPTNAGHDLQAYVALERIRERVFETAIQVKQILTDSMFTEDLVNRDLQSRAQQYMLKVLHGREKVESTMRELNAQFALRIWPLAMTELVSPLEESIGKLDEIMKKHQDIKAKLVTRVDEAADVGNDAAMNDAVSTSMPVELDEAADIGNDTTTKDAVPASMPVEQICDDEAATAESRRLLNETRDVTENIVLLRKQIKKTTHDARKGVRHIRLDESAAPKKQKTELFALTLAIRNIVNGRPVQRPTNMSETDSWNVEYAFREITNEDEARREYRKACALREEVERNNENEDWLRAWHAKPFIRELMEMSAKGRERRKLQDELDSQRGERVVFTSNEDMRRRASATAS